MAEIVGLTASIAGLVALTCQIGKSVLFIKGFLEDTKNAPEDIRSLASEIDLLCSAAKTTDTLLVKCQAEGLDMDFEEEHKGLTRYADMIEKLKAKIEKDVTTFGSGKGLWWERVGSAARKKSVEGYLRGVERAKTLVLDIEAKIMIQLQLHHRDSLITTNKSLGTLQVSSDRHTTTLNRMETQTTQISAWTGTTDQTLNTLSMEVQQISSSLNTFLPAIQTLQHQSTSQPELSALESMLESAVFRGMKRHHEEMQNSQPSSSHFHTPEIAGTGTNTALRNTNKSFDFGSHTMLRRDKTVFQTAFRTPLFDIDIQTKEVQWMPKRKRDTTVHEVFQVKPSRSQRFTTYAVRVKIPFWRGGMTYHSGNAGMMYGGSLCKTFRTYNIVPWNAPIIAACERFDLPEVRRLFEAGLASPFDCHMDVTLVDTVLLSFTELPNQYLNAQAAINLLEYLICCCGGDIGRVRMLYQIFSRVAIRSFSEQDITSLAEAARLIFGHCSEDPTNGLETFLTIHVSRTPLFQALIRQDVWYVDDMIQPAEAATFEYWGETDFQMLKDPDGIFLKTALKSGYEYSPSYWEYYSSANSPLHVLLAMASKTIEDEFHICVRSRLIILLESGVDPRVVSFVEGAFAHHIGMKRAMSCTEFAQFLDLGNLWASALDGAGWETAAINELFEEDLSQAVAALLDGEIEFRSQEDNRREFIRALRCGELGHLTYKQLYDLARHLDFELGLFYAYIDNIIFDVISIFKERKTPGSWLDEDMMLMPGVDFQLPYSGSDQDQIKNWQCIREIWDNELGGCIPEGYAGDKYDERTKQWYFSEGASEDPEDHNGSAK